MKTTINTLTLILTTACCSIAAPGDLDTSFGTGGKVITPIGSSNDKGYGVVVQSNGKIVVAGTSVGDGGNYDFALVRYNTDGSLDTTFGIDGKVITPIGSSDDQGSGAVVQSNGKIIVAGYSYYPSDLNNGSYNLQFALARYNENGSSDTGFGASGNVTTRIGGSSDEILSVAVQGDGKIVAAGSSYNGSNHDFALVRYNGDGSLDTGFGSGGKVTTAIGTDNMGYGVVVQSNGKIVVAGTSVGDGGNYDFALVRYNTDGSLDTGFGSGGKLTTAVGSGNAFCFGIAEQSNGKIVVTGASGMFTSNALIALVRYNGDGSLDTGFGSGGKVTTAIGSGGASGSSVALQSNSKIVVAGTSFNGSNNDFALVRYNTDGSLDTTFGIDGKVITPIGSNSGEEARGVAVQGNGKIVVAGYSFNSGNFDFALAQYAGDPTPDIIVEQPAGNNLTDGAALIDFGVQQVGGFSERTFTVNNAGNINLAGVGVTINGAAATDFAVTAAPDTTVTDGGSTTFSVRFAPVATGTKTADLHIASNDPDESPFDITLTGQALDPTADDDGDGVTNAAEINLAALGFDPLVNNTPMIELLRANGLYRVSDMQALALGSPLLEKNEATGHFHLRVSVEKSADLKTWTPLTDFTPAFNAATGKVDIEITPAATNTSFYRVLGAKP